MTLKFFGELGSGTMVLDDDTSLEDIAEKLMIAATEEQGNGREKRRSENYAN